MLIVEEPAKTPKRVPAVAVTVEPVKLMFLTVSFVAPAPVPVLSRQTTAELVPAFVFVIVMSRPVPPAAFEPSIVTQSAPFRLIMHDELLPVNVGLTPAAGLIVMVFVELEPVLALMVIGYVSDP